MAASIKAGLLIYTIIKISRLHPFKHRLTPGKSNRQTGECNLCRLNLLIESQALHGFIRSSLIYRSHDSEPNYSVPRTPASDHCRCKLHRRVFPGLAPGSPSPLVFSALDFKLPANKITSFLQTICRSDLQTHEYEITTSATRPSVFSRFGRWCGVFGYGGGDRRSIYETRLLRC
jgi:hypothetical protein